jgi:beta-lactamase regulating signal transducer with metallopeptidase domain
VIHWLNDHTTIAVMHAIARSLLHFLWQGALIACIFASLIRVVTKSSAQLRYTLGCAALALMAIAPVTTFAIILHDETPHPTLLASTPLVIAAAPIDAIAAPTSARISTPLLAMVAAWTLGTSICMVWLTGGWLQMRCLRRLHAMPLPARTEALIAQLTSSMHVRAAVRLVDSVLVRVPMTIGWISPVILLPASILAGLSTPQLKAIIAHELAHVRRWDYFINLLQRVVESILFYHPAVWWVSSRIRQEREYCCDDVAAAMCGDCVVYAQALAELETLRADAMQLALSLQGGSLMNRIARLLNVPCPAVRPLMPWRSTAIAAALALTGATAAFALSHQPQAHSTQSSARIDATQDCDIIAECVVQLDLQSDDENALVTDARHSYIMLTVDGEIVGGDGEPQFSGSVQAEHAQPAEVGRMITLQLALQLVPQPEPIDELIEAEELFYPWDIFEIMLGIEPEQIETPAEASILLEHVIDMHDVPIVLQYVIE